MPFSRDMIEAARPACSWLDQRAETVRLFLNSRHNADGGFAGRDPVSDIYYTAFGVDSFLALGDEPPDGGLADFVAAVAPGDELDLVHLACLVRCRARLASLPGHEEFRLAVLRQVDRHRCSDGGFNTVAGATAGSVTGAFLAAAACEDLGVPLPGAERCLESLHSLRSADGGYANEAGLETGTTLATAGVVILSHALGAATDPRSVLWLLERRSVEGGFLSSPRAPIPDLLSTATAVYALDMVGAATDESRVAGVQLAESLWSDSGGFGGFWFDDTPDVEYTFYGLLTLGCCT